MLKIVLTVDGDTSDPQGLKEALAMELERFGPVRVLDVKRIEAERMRIRDAGDRMAAGGNDHG